MKRDRLRSRGTSFPIEPRSKLIVPGSMTGRGHQAAQIRPPNGQKVGRMRPGHGLRDSRKSLARTAPNRRTVRKGPDRTAHNRRARGRPMEREKRRIANDGKNHDHFTFFRRLPRRSIRGMVSSDLAIWKVRRYFRNTIILLLISRGSFKILSEK